MVPVVPVIIGARALQLGERLDLKGLERDDCFSKNPLGFSTATGGTVVLFKSGAAVFLNMTPVDEEAMIASLAGRISEPVSERDVETASIITSGDEDTILPNGAVQLRSADPHRLLVIAEALAASVSLSYDERRVAKSFDQIATVSEHLKDGSLSGVRYKDTLRQIGEALSTQSRLAGRIDLNDKPDVLWDHPDLERLWAKLADDYDLKVRANAVAEKLTVIRDTADTLSNLLSTRTSHRLEWYVIALIAIEIALGLYDRFWK